MLILSIIYLKNDQSHVLNCGYGKGFSAREVVKSCKEVTGIHFKAIETERRAGDPALLISNPKKIKATINWLPKYDDLNVIVESAWNGEKSLYN